MTKNNSLRLLAHAKINLHLNIGPRRKDGYHDLQTLFQEIALADELTLAAAPRSTFSLTNQTSMTLKASPDNLVMKALKLLRSTLNIDQGIRVHLTKKIPIGAGLGGGSSDAAAALRGAYQLWTGDRSNKHPAFLFDVAKQLGADVPFFLKGGTVWAEGVGEKLKSVKSSPKQWIILVYPRVHVSTPLAYKLLDNSRGEGLRRKSFSNRPSRSFYNSFEPVIDQHFPMVAIVKETLRYAGCKSVLMSGSGSSVFGCVDSKSQGEKVLKLLRPHKWDIFLTHTI